MSRSPAQILVVDDEIHNRKLLELLLGSDGYQTRSAANGEEALASVAADAPDLILLDIMMPDMDGYQVARSVKANAATANIPIIMVTAQIDHSARLAGLDAGVEEFLTKPVDRAELWLRVRNLLRLKSLGNLLQEHNARLEEEVLARTASLEQTNEQLRAEIRLRQTIEIELQMAQKLEAVGRLAAGIAHEINTPIQYIGLSAHYLDSAFKDLFNIIDARDGTQMTHADTELDFLRDEVPRSVGRIVEGTGLVASIVRALGEFAHPGAGEKAAADLNRAIETTSMIARNEYKHVATVNLELGRIPDVFCDVGEVSQVFLNLIVNAAHALADVGRSPETGRITIRTQHVGDWVEIEFEDNGCGIPEENIGKIYDPFFTTKEVGRGSGQGLAIAWTIVVDKHQGRISVLSTLDTGTCFTVRLPVSNAAVCTS